MKRKLYGTLVALLALVLLVCGGFLAYHALDNRRGAETYIAASEAAGLPRRLEAPEDWAEERDPYAAILAQTDLAALREVNGDVAGWITIPETELSYPLLRAEDNRYYLNHTWSKESSSVGAIFLECRGAQDLSAANTIVYGHRMRNNSMFGSLKYYKNPAYWQEHPSVYMAVDDGVYRYDIFAACEAGVTSPVYWLDVEEDHAEEFLRYSMERSVIDTGIIPERSDQILTLSTCTGTGYAARWVVQGRLARVYQA